MKHSSTQRHGGPASLRERAVSRREVLSKSVGAFGTVLGAALWIPTLGYAEEIGGSFPKPIAGGFKPPFTERFIHAFEPERGHEPAFITDFKGFVGLAVVTGTGTGTDKRTGAASRLLFVIDNRFMKGVYIGTDGRQYHGTFGFL